MNQLVLPPVVAGDPETITPDNDGGAEERVLNEIAALGLERNAWELDTRGFTILSPAQVGAPDFVAQLRARIFQEAGLPQGAEGDLSGGITSQFDVTALGRCQFLPEIFFADRLFEEALMRRPVLALISYLLGESCILTGMNAVIKGPGPEGFPLHTDTPQPAPLPAFAQVANATWLLTDYTVENGPTVFVPGSHKACRSPTREESVDFSRAVPVEAPAGSILIWHGNTWHGGAARTAPGMRISLITYFARYYMRPPSAGAYAERVTQEMLDRNPPRFARLMHHKPLSVAGEWVCRISHFA